MSTERIGGIFTRSLIVSALFHLSAVTVFSIVIYFPREDIQYYDVAIVETRVPVRPLTTSASSPLSESTGFERLGLSGPDFGQAEQSEFLPAIQLPTLQFEELNLLRMRRQVLDTRSRYNQVFSEIPEDTWARFGAKLETVGETLSRLTFGDDEHENAPMPVSRPAPGFEAYIEWMGEPYDRQVLSVEPIRELWGLNPADLSEPIALIFRVDHNGQVVEVIDPLGDDAGIVAASAEALKGYRFEPLLGDGMLPQTGTLIIRSQGRSHD